MFNIGDTVRFIHSTGEGVIKNIINDTTFEIEIEDGFLIPALKKDLVKIVTKEDTGAISTKQEYTVQKSDGIFVAFDAFNDRVYSMMLINDTHQTVLYSMYEDSTIATTNIAGGSIAPRSHLKISEYKSAEFANWPELLIQIVTFSKQNLEIQPIIENRLKFQASTFYKSNKFIKLINKNVCAYKIDSIAKKINELRLVEKLTNATPTISNNTVSTKSEIDLHIEKLTQTHTMMKPHDILQLQIQTFENNLEKAIASNMDKITFIHGVGNNVLKNEIHKKLAQNRTIKFFQDAQKEKFGYGATLVQLL